MVESHRGGYHCCDQCAGFSPFPGQGSCYIHVGLSLCDVTAASFCLSFASFFFRSYASFFCRSLASKKHHMSQHCLLCRAWTSCPKSGEVTPKRFTNSTVANCLLTGRLLYTQRYTVQVKHTIYVLDY